MVLLGRLRDNDLQNLQLLREKDALISQMKDIKQTSVRKFQLQIKFLMLEHQTSTQDLKRQHETSTQDPIHQHERSTDELVCQREESLYELKLEIGRLQERVDAREEQHDFALVEQANGYEFALVEQANGYEYHIQVKAAAFAHDFESQANQFRNALRLERQAHQGIVARDRGSYLRALAVDEGCHERAMELEQDAHERAITLERDHHRQALGVQTDAIRLEKQRHFKLMHFCSMLGEHVDCLNDGSERLNEENERLQEQVRDGFRFESNMDDLENTVERMETELLDEFNVVKQVVQVRPHSNGAHGGGKSLTWCFVYTPSSLYSRISPPKRLQPTLRR